MIKTRQRALLAGLALAGCGVSAHELEEVVVGGRSLVLIKQARSIWRDGRFCGPAMCWKLSRAWW